jgi:hypothetical protein
MVLDYIYKPINPSIASKTNFFLGITKTNHKVQYLYYSITKYNIK